MAATANPQTSARVGLPAPAPQANKTAQANGAAPTPGPAAAPRRHILDLDDFSAAEIEATMQNADAMLEVLRRDIKKVPALRGKTIITLFYEASTRTRVSFEQAGKILSADVINVSGGGSSVEKGESLYNTALTLQAMNADIIVMRHPHSGAPHFLARHLSAVVINAGDGAHAHPTQALLDLYTLRRHRGSVAGAKVVIVGDLLYSRVARSNLWGLTRMGADVTLCAPPTLLPPDFLRGFGPAASNGAAGGVNGAAGASGGGGVNGAAGASGGDVNGASVRGAANGASGAASASDAPPHPFASVRIETNVERALHDADVVMALRLQTERQRAGHLPTLREYSKMYGITPARMKLAKPDALVMHPGPMNEGVEIDSDVAHGAQSIIEEQVTNGVAVRMALFYAALGAGGAV